MRKVVGRNRNGVALISALLTVAVATAASASLAVAIQVWLRLVQNAGDHAQADAFVSVGFDWACEILTEKAKRSDTDALGDPWARPIGPIELGPGRVQVEIVDAQSFFNINSLGRGGARSGPDVETFRRLLVSRHLDGGLAEAAATRVLAVGPLVEPEDLLDLYGVTPAVFEQLRPWLAALPDPTTVNINTASRELLQALFPSLDDAGVDRMLAARLAKALQEGPDAAEAREDSRTDGSLYSVGSSYFFVRSTGGAGRIQLTARALVRRPINGEPAYLLWRSDER